MICDSCWYDICLFHQYSHSFLFRLDYFQQIYNLDLSTHIYVGFGYRKKIFARIADNIEDNFYRRVTYIGHHSSLFLFNRDAVTSDCQ